MVKRTIEISESTSIRLSNMTILGTFLIMLMHLPYAGVPSDTLPDFVYSVAYLAVPLFFMVSGYLVAVKANGEGWYKRLIKHRFRSLVLPYFALNTLFVPFLYIYHNILNLGNWKEGGLAFDWYTISRVYGLTYQFHPVCGVLWYVRCLVIFIVIAPLIVFLIKRSLRASVIYISLLLLAVSFFETTAFARSNWPFFYSFFNIRGLFYFSCGGLMSWICIEQWRLRRIIGFLCLVMGGLLLLFVDLQPYTNLLTQFLFVLSIWFLMPPVKMPAWVVSSCFALYVFHSIFYGAFNFMIPRIAIVKDLVAAIPLLPLGCTLIACYSMTFMIRNYCPRLGLVLFGGRC